MTVGAAALDAAEQARRAAELAEQAASAALGAASGAKRGGEERPRPVPAAPARDADSMRDFSERADRLVERLQQIQRLPLTQPDARQHTR